MASEDVHTIVHYSYCFMQVSAISLLCISITFCIAIYEGVISFCAVRCFNPDCCRASISLWAISPTIAEVLLLDQYTRVGSYPRHLHGERMHTFLCTFSSSGKPGYKVNIKVHAMSAIALITTISLLSLQSFGMIAFGKIFVLHYSITDTPTMSILFWFILHHSIHLPPECIPHLHLTV